MHATERQRRVFHIFPEDVSAVMSHSLDSLFYGTHSERETYGLHRSLGSDFEDDGETATYVNHANKQRIKHMRSARQFTL
jgi:hypothetical protein